LRDIGYAEAPCLVAAADEGYTYKNRINRLSTIQEHYMIRRAIERGVSPERLSLDTLCLHAGQFPNAATGVRVTPIGFPA